MDERAVSPVIGTVMVLAILTVVTATMLTVVWPEIQDSRDRGEFGVVVTQLGAIAADSRQMASLGNVGEMRQGSVAMSGGVLGMREGHVYAVSTTLKGLDYHSVQTETELASTVDRFRVLSAPAVEPGSSAFTVAYENVATTPSATLLDRFDGRRWVAGASGTCASGECPVTLGALSVRDGPWRVRVMAGSDTIGEVYVYDQSRIVYDQYGRKDRGAVIENGALFSYEERTVLQVVPSLWQGFAQSEGGTLQARSTDYSGVDMPEAAGRTTATLAFSTLVHAHLAHQQGGIETRVQVLSGPDVAVWYKHLEHVGFMTDGDPERGVVHHVEVPSSSPLAYSVYPFSLVHVELGTRMEVR